PKSRGAHDSCHFGAFSFKISGRRPRLKFWRVFEYRRYSSSASGSFGSKQAAHDAVERRSSMSRLLLSRFHYILVSVALLGGVAQLKAQNGEAVFNQLCVNCHTEGSPTQAPLPDVLRKMSADAIFEAEQNGKMKAMAAGLTEAERMAVAKYLGTADA